MKTIMNSTLGFIHSLGLNDLSIHADFLVAKRKGKLVKLSAYLGEPERARENIEQFKNVECPFLIKPLEILKINDEYILVSEYHKEISFEKFLSSKSEITVSETLAIVKKLATALMVLHNLDLIHGNIQPSSIFFSNDKPMISDLANCISSEIQLDLDEKGNTITKPQESRNKLGYLAPELFSDSSSNIKTDIYSLGIIIFVLSTRQISVPEFISDSDLVNLNDFIRVLVQKSTHKDPLKRLDSSDLLSNINFLLPDK